MAIIASYNLVDSISFKTTINQGVDYKVVGATNIFNKFKYTKIIRTLDDKLLSEINSKHKNYHFDKPIGKVITTYQIDGNICGHLERSYKTNSCYGQIIFNSYKTELGMEFLTKIVENEKN